MRKSRTRGLAALAGWAAAVAVTGFAAVTLAGGHGTQAAPRPAVCHFDGGGSITAGNAARTTDGRTWLCTEDGRLVRIG